MPVITPKESGGVRVSPATYIVTCINVEADHLDNSMFGNGDVWRFDLALDGELDAAGEPIILDAIANAVLSPKSKAWGWIEAFGFKLQVGVPFNTDNLIGRKAQADVRDKPSKDNTAVFSTVHNIVALPKGSAAAPPAAPSTYQAPPAPSGNGVTIGAFWARVRAAKVDVKEINQLSMATYGKEPKDLADAERDALLAKATATVDCEHSATYTPDGVMVCEKCGVVLEDEPAGVPA